MPRTAMIFNYLFAFVLPAVAAHPSNWLLPQSSSDISVQTKLAEYEEPTPAMSLVQLGVAQSRSRLDKAKVDLIDKLVFIKLHSVGSSTMTSILHHFCLFHEKNCFVYPVSEKPMGHTVHLPELRTITEHFETGQVPALDVWPNHVDMESQLDELIPGSFKFALFRSPFDRVMSGFRHGTVQEVQDVMSQLQQNITADFCGEAGQLMSGQITEQQVQQLDLVMLTEQYDLSLMMLRKALGWSMFDMMYLMMKSDHPEDVVAATVQLEEYLTRPWDELNVATKNYFQQCIGVDGDVFHRANLTFTQQWQSLSELEQQQLQDDTTQFGEARKLLEQCCEANPEDGYCAVLSEDNEAWNFRQEEKGLEYGTLRFDMQPESPPQESSCMSLVSKR